MEVSLLCFWQLYSKSFVDGNVLSVSQEMPVSRVAFFSWLYCYLGFSCFQLLHLQPFLTV